MSVLFPYQVAGRDWLAGRARGYLADEMGLGKTPQAIVAFDRTAAYSACVICPASVCENWRREIERWSLTPWLWTVVSYDIAVRRGIPEAGCYVVDEAHYLKSPTAKRTKSILGPASPLHRADHIWALSGTPAPNNASELWTWLSFFGATRLKYRAFIERYCRYLDTPYGPRIVGNNPRHLPELKEMVEGAALRRMKADVLKDLPSIRWGDITVMGNVDTCVSLSADIIIAAEDLPAQDEAITTLRRLIGEAKAPALGAFLAEELEGGSHNIVVFAHHRAVMDVLEEALSRFGVARIDGNTLTSRRAGIVDDFQAGRCRVFLGQIQAAGVGVTLTAACDLVFAEMSWVPGENAQAAMRVHRVGQTKPVLIRTANLRGSIDEQINAVLVRKTRMLEEIYGRPEKEAA